MFMGFLQVDMFCAEKRTSNVTMLLCKGREVFFFYADSLNGDEGCEGHCLDQSKVLLQVVLQTFDLFLVEGGLVGGIDPT